MNDAADVGNDAVMLQTRAALDAHAANARAMNRGRYDVDDDGTHRCVECGEVVPEARVKAMPFSGLCVRCAS